MFKDCIKEIRRLVGHQPLILTSVMVLIVDSEGRLLLQKRAGTGSWHVPGGFLELGKALEDAARREALAETGLFLGALTLVGAYSGLDFHGFAPGGDEVYNVTVAYLAQDVSGTPVADGPDGKEETEVIFTPPSPLPEPLGPPARPNRADGARNTLNAVL